MQPNLRLQGPFSTFLLIFTVLFSLSFSPTLFAKKKESSAPGPLRYEGLSPSRKVAYIARLIFLGKDQEASERVAEGEPAKLDSKGKKRFTLLKAYLEMKQNRPGEAADLLDSLDGHYPELSPLLPYWRAKASRLSGSPQKAIQILEKFCGGPCLPAEAPEAPPVKVGKGKNKKVKAAGASERASVGPSTRVIREYASALCETADASRGREIFLNLLSASGDGERDVTRFEGILCLKKSGGEAQAFEDLRSLFVQAPGAVSKKELEEALKGMNGRAFSEEDFSLRISNLKSQERWGEAAQELKEFLAAHPSERPLRRNETAETLFKARLYREAAEAYEEIVQDPSQTDKTSALERLGSAYARSNQFDKALKIQREILSLDEAGGASQKISYKIAFLLADAGRCEEAAQAFQEFFDRFPKSPQRDDALWQKAWCEYRLGRSQNSLRDLRLLLEEFPRGNYAPRATYWVYRIASLVPEEDGAEAKAVFLEKYSETFYERWDRVRRTLPSNQCPALPFGSQPAEERLSPSSFYGFSESDRVALAELMTLGLWEDFMEIYRKGPGDEGASPNDLKKWIHLFAEQEGVSEELVWAVLREESRFKSKALSSAGAMGLMQIIPQTGYDIARSLNWRSFQPSDLYRPIANVRMGVHYLGTLLRQFSGNSIYAIASYNAGPEAVERWDRQRQSRPCEEFIEEIPYRETHLYVKKVMRSLWNFRDNPSAFYAGE